MLAGINRLEVIGLENRKLYSGLDSLKSNTDAFSFKIKKRGEKMEEVRLKSHLSRFLNLRCSGDILNVVNPINNPEKEISESWSILRKIKPLTLSDKMQYNILDLCAGNALTSIISIFVLPVKSALAMDIKVRKRHYELAQRFDYQEQDIHECEVYNFIDRNTIIVSSHPCKHALRIIEIFNNSLAKALCLIPCCNGEFDDLPGIGFLKEKLNQIQKFR